MNELKFYRRQNSNEVIYFPKGAPKCEHLVEMKVNTTEAAREKHIPVYRVEGSVCFVDVGSVIHPMSEEHLIEWVALHTSEGVRFKIFSHEDAPKASFALASDEKVLGCYAYCNLHGIWAALEN